MSSAELLYRCSVDPKERRRIASDVVRQFSPNVARLARKLVPLPHLQEAEQVGAIGVLVALEKYDPSRGVPFWAYAAQWVTKEIQTWSGKGIYWRPTTAGAKGRSVHVEHLTRAEYVDDAAHDQVVDSVEALAGEHEAAQRLKAFLSTLTEEEVHLLLCEKRERGNPNSDHVRRYRSLVERARVFVRGEEEP